MARPNTRLAYSTEDPGVPRRKERERRKPASVAAKGIRLRLDRRASSRLVTTITGLPGGSSELTELARQLRSRCGTGGTLKQGVVELQGDHRETVERFLAERGLEWKRAGG